MREEDMGLIARLFGRTKQSASAVPVSRMQSQMNSANTSQHGTATGTTPRELLRVVLRDTMGRHGIPAGWIAGEVLNTTSRTNERGLHWRLVVKHWDPRLVTCSIAFQQALIKRLTSFDPLASSWLTGISWQFALDDESQCPPMPHPGAWTQMPAEDEQPAVAATAQVSGDVIEGPVRIAGVTADIARDADAARADLEQLLAIRDADFRDNAAAKQAWTPTEPARL
jgi:hypothetical protein